MQQVIRKIPWTVFGWFPDGLPIYGFGLMLFLAFILCTWLAGWRVKKMILSGIGLGRYLGGPHQGEDYPAAATPEEQIEAAKALVQDLAIWLFISGLVGARLAFMSHQNKDGFFGLLQDVWTQPRSVAAQLIDITNGGIILYGSIVGALVGYLGFLFYHYWLRTVLRNLLCPVFYFLFGWGKYTHEAHNYVVLHTLRIADLAAPSLALGIGLGRIGCLLNGCCYGHVACADCALVPAVHFPMSAPPRYELVKKGYQTAAGFTFAEQQTPEKGVTVGAVAPNSAAALAGLQKDDVITAVNDKPLDSDNPREQLSRALFDDWPRGEKDLKLTVEPGDRVLDFRPKTLGLLPTQAFETVSMALLFLLLSAFYVYRRRDGQVIALLMMCYAVHRTLNEMLRDDVRPVGFEAYSSYLLFAAGALLMLWVTRKPAQYTSEWELAVT